MKKKTGLIIIGLVILMGVAGGVVGYEIAQDKVIAHQNEYKRLESEWLCKNRNLQVGLEAIENMYEESCQSNIDMENSFVDYMVGLTSRLAGKELTEEDITEEYFEGLITDLTNRPKIVEEKVYVDRIVTENVTIETREFESEQEMVGWLDTCDTYEHVLLLRALLGEKKNCFDYSREMAKDGQEKGFETWVQALHHPYERPDTGELLTITEDGEICNHDVVSTVVNGIRYYIEPNSQPYEYWQASRAYRE